MRVLCICYIEIESASITRKPLNHQRQFLLHFQANDAALMAQTDPWRHIYLAFQLVTNFRSRNDKHSVAINMFSLCRSRCARAVNLLKFSLNGNPAITSTRNDRHKVCIPLIYVKGKLQHEILQRLLSNTNLILYHTVNKTEIIFCLFKN